MISGNVSLRKILIHNSGFETRIMNCGEWNVIGDYFEQARCNAAKKMLQNNIKFKTVFLDQLRISTCDILKVKWDFPILS